MPGSGKGAVSAIVQLAPAVRPPTVVEPLVTPAPRAIDAGVTTAPQVTVKLNVPL